MILLLKARAKAGQIIEVTVQGVSMRPLFRAGDVIAVQKREEYRIGDILVYPYKREGLLVHRLLRVANGRLYCKGDNSFRLEDMEPGQVIGKALSLNGEPIRYEGLKFRLLCRYSLYIGRLFVKKRYQIEAVKQSFTYRLYRLMFLRS